MTSIDLTQGQEVALPTEGDRPLTRLRMGLGWDKLPTAGFIGTGAPDVDLDASAVQFAGDQLFDLAFYNNASTRDGSVTHLGDNLTGRGEGDDEVISVDLGRVYPKVDTIVFLVSSYHGHTLEWVDRAYCRLLRDDDAEVEAEVGAEVGAEVARITLTLGVPQTGLAMAKLVRREGQWVFHAIGEGIAVTRPTESVRALQRFL